MVFLTWYLACYIACFKLLGRRWRISCPPTYGLLQPFLCCSFSCSAGFIDHQTAPWHRSCQQNHHPLHLSLPRQWPEVSDFVARFCTLHESENTLPYENCTRLNTVCLACNSRMAVCLACNSRMAVCFLTSATCKKGWHKSYTSGHCLPLPTSPLLFVFPDSAGVEHCRRKLVVPCLELARHKQLEPSVINHVELLERFIEALLQLVLVPGVRRLEVERHSSHCWKVGHKSLGEVWGGKESWSCLRLQWQGTPMLHHPSRQWSC